LVQFLDYTAYLKKTCMYSSSQFVSSADRFGVYGADEHQVHHLSKKLKFPVEDILKAVQEVGFDSEEVEEYIRDRYNRGF
jgi:hypothetical protein